MQILLMHRPYLVIVFKKYYPPATYQAKIHDICKMRYKSWSKCYIQGIRRFGLMTHSYI